VCSLVAQESDFKVHSLALSMTLFCCTLSALACSFVMMLVQLRGERARMERERLAAKARRLRYVDDEKVVHPPEIAADRYHGFLSHVWGTGRALLQPKPTPTPQALTQQPLLTARSSVHRTEDQMRIVKQRLLEMMPEIQIFLGARGGVPICPPLGRADEPEVRESSLACADVDDLEEIGDLEVCLTPPCFHTR
jgi:hypothetical protein